MLALVEVGEDGQAAEPVYVRRPFENEPGWGVSSVNYDWGLLAAKGTAPGASPL